MSDAAARSMPDAAARSSIPPRASVLCLASHPASAMYLRASALSVAENTVVSPYSLAVSLSILRSSPVAPVMAWTSLMVEVKSIPTWIVCFMKSLRADTAMLMPFLARFTKPSLSLSRPFFTAPDALSLRSSNAFWSVPAFFSSSSVSFPTSSSASL